MLPFSFETTKQELNTRHLNINTVDLFPLAMYPRLSSRQETRADSSGLGLEAPPDSKDSSPLGSRTTLVGLRFRFQYASFIMGIEGLGS